MVRRGQLNKAGRSWLFGCAVSVCESVWFYRAGNDCRRIYRSRSGYAQNLFL